jgi:hypothetical protein
MTTNNSTEETILNRLNCPITFTVNLPNILIEFHELPQHYGTLVDIYLVGEYDTWKFTHALQPTFRVSLTGVPLGYYTLKLLPQHEEVIQNPYKVSCLDKEWLRDSLIKTSEDESHHIPIIVSRKPETNQTELISQLLTPAARFGGTSNAFLSTTGSFTLSSGGGQFGNCCGTGLCGNPLRRECLIYSISRNSIKI